MDIFRIRQELKTKSIYDVPMRVTFYARVSSEKDAQLNSLDNQVDYYEDFIKSNTNWTYINGYVDEGLSAISTKKRQNFLYMIEDAKNDRFDFIITKEISRFARNTVDSIQYTRDLLHHGVGVLFQNDNINTLDEDSELRLTIMSGIAQDELRKLSSRIKFGHAQAIKNHVVLGNSRIFGYKKNDKKLVIDEPEAKMVRELFELYSTGNYSMKQIERMFWNKGYKNHNGNPISHTTMANMIKNPKYKGFYVGNKVKIVDMFTKKQEFLPKEEWVMAKDEESVPPIVDEELWEKANDVLEERSLDVKTKQNKCTHRNLLTGKLFCTHCGTPYYRKESKDKKGNVNSQWRCKTKLEKGTKTCPSVTIYESEIRDVLYDVFLNTSKQSESFIEEYLKIYKEIIDKNSKEKQIKELESQIKAMELKIEKLLDFNMSGHITDEEYLLQSKSIVERIKNLKSDLDNLTIIEEAQKDFGKKLKELQKTLSESIKQPDSSVITYDFVQKYFDKIYVTPNMDNNTISLEIKLFSGQETIKKISAKARSYPTQSKKVNDFFLGQMSLMMCPKRTIKVVRENRTLSSHKQHLIYEYTILIE